MRPRLVAISLFVAIALVVPTVAMSGGGVDDVDGKVELVPHDGPNGEYATVEDGEIRVDFAQLNEDAKTTAHDVFNVTSTANETIEVWVETDVNESVTPYRGDDPGASIDSENAVTLEPNETVSVGFSVETFGNTPNSGNFTVGVRDPEDGSSGGGSSGGSGSNTADSGVTPTPTPTPTPPPDEDPDVVRPALGVEVVFEGDVDGNEVTVRSLDRLPADGPSRSPRAVIDRGSSLYGVTEDGLDVRGTQFVAQEDAPIHLTGSQSYVSPADGIAREPRPMAIVDITPPSELRNTPALIRLEVDRDAFPETNATDARIGRHTPDGWQLLPTQVVEETDETVLLEARTQGFSVFTVFAESTVQYEWELPNGRTVVGDDLRTSFAEAGRYNVTLTVTDAFGRTGTTQHRLLVNDPPSVVIEKVSGSTDDEVTLRANVTDRFGNTTVTWTLPNGSMATGPTVSGSFQAGDSVSVTVRDEYGGVGSTETVIAVAPAGPGGAVSFLPVSLPLWQYVLLAAGAIVVAMAIVQSGLVIRLPTADEVVAATGLSLLVDDSPRITRCSEPRWNPGEERVEIDALEVSAPSGLLRSIELAVTDADGTPVVTRTIDVGARSSYSARPEYIPVYGDVGLSADGRYRLEVRAVDENDLVGALEGAREWTVGSTA